MSKLNNVVGILCAVIVCTIGIISQQCNLSHQDRIRSAAESLYPALVSFEFDGIEILESEKQIPFDFYFHCNDFAIRNSNLKRFLEPPISP